MSRADIATILSSVRRDLFVAETSAHDRASLGDKDAGPMTLVQKGIGGL
ncbi:MAG TPA: hypothetical protein VGM62_08100 [Chthoniobacterales bacterium]